MYEAPESFLDSDCNLFSFQLIPHASHSWVNSRRYPTVHRQCTTDGDRGRMAEVTLPLCCKYCMVWINHKVRTVRTVYETIPKEASPCSETVNPDSKGWSHPERQPVKLCNAYGTSNKLCMTRISMSLPACRCGSFSS